MMNVLGLSLMLTSLVVACVFSPYSSSSSSPNSNTIVKDGHRVVVVEYDQDGNHNTKISISPPGHVVQGGSDDHHHHASKELICDVYGRCKHKITDAMDRTKDMMSETAHDTINMIYDKKENAADVVGKARETVYNRAHNLQQQTKETVDKAKEKAHDVQQQTKETVDKGKEKAHDVQQQTKETVDKAKEKAHDVKQQTKETVDKAKEKGQRFKEHVVRNVSEAKDSLGNAVRRGATNIVGSMEKVTGVANLLGFATAYGMNVWVTFISSYVLSRAMPRQSFGMVQSKIYPLYFRAMAYCIGIALLGHVLSHTKGMPHIFQAYNLLASLFTVFINSLYLEPRATKLMLERMKIEKEEGRGRDDVMSGERSGNRTRQHHHHNTTVDPKEPSTTTTTTTTKQGIEHDAMRSRIMKLNEKLKTLNSYSSILNILNLMSLTWHLVYLAQRIHLTC